MSHTTKLNNVPIRDISALQTAVSKLQAEGVKCSLVADANPRMYYERQTEKCDYVLKLDDSPYDVGFQYDPKTQTYAPMFDEYNKKVAAQIGADVNVCPMPKSAEGRAQHQLGKLMQHYAEAAAVNSAIMQGYSVESTTTDEQGNVHVTLTGM